MSNEGRERFDYGINDDHAAIMINAVADFVQPGDKTELTTPEAITRIREACFDLYDLGHTRRRITQLIFDTVKDVEAHKARLDEISPGDFLRG